MIDNEPEASTRRPDAADPDMVPPAGQREHGTPNRGSRGDTAGRVTAEYPKNHVRAPPAAPTFLFAAGLIRSASWYHFHPGSARGRLDVPTVLRDGPHRFYFHSHEPEEPPHVHVDRDDKSAKFWLSDVRLARNRGFAAHEVRRIERSVRLHQTQLMEAWNEFFGP